MDHIKILQDLISIDTTVPPGRNYGEAMSYLEPLFQQVNFETEKIAIPPQYAEGREGRAALVCHRRSLGRPRLIFYAHVDVVPAEGWDAFKPRVEKGRIYGRGAADMKGAIASLLLGLDAVKDKPLRYDLSVVITTDEEYSQADQIRYLARFLEPVSGSYVFSLDDSFGSVAIADLGLLQMKVRVKGKSVHSGLANLGVNAVEKAVLLLQALLELKSRVVQRKSKTRVHPDTGLTQMQARLNINMIQGGLKVNIVPDECLISIDRRLIPEETVADAEKELMETLRSVRGVDWEVVEVLRIPTVPPCEAPIVDELARVIKDVTGKTGKYGEMGSGDLSHIVTTEWKATTFGLGVSRPECNYHGKDEFVYQKDVEYLAEIIARFVKE